MKFLPLFFTLCFAVLLTACSRGEYCPIDSKPAIDPKIIEEQEKTLEQNKAAVAAQKEAAASVLQQIKDKQAASLSTRVEASTEAPKSVYGKHVQSAVDAKAVIEDRNPDSIRPQ